MLPRIFNKCFLLISLQLLLLWFVGANNASSQPAYQVALYVSLHPRAPPIHYCNGAIVHNRLILTTASCVYYPSSYVDIQHSAPLRIGPSKISVVAGVVIALNILNTFEVLEVNIAPAFNITTLANNLAILRLDTSLPLGERDDVKWIIMDDYENNVMGSYLAGFPSLNLDPSIVRFENIPILHNEQCTPIIRNGDICGRYPYAVGPDYEFPEYFPAFNSDYGTGLILRSNLVAIFSNTLLIPASKNCHDYPLKAIFTKLGPHLDWIYGIIAKEEILALNKNGLIHSAPYQQRGNSAIKLTADAIDSTTTETTTNAIPKTSSTIQSLPHSMSTEINLRPSPITSGTLMVINVRVFGILRGLDCQKFLLNPDLYSSDSHTINSNDGSLYVAANTKNYTNNQYCVEKIRNSTFGEQKLYSFLCFDSNVVSNDKIRFKMYPIGLLISCSFYALTLGVYLSISRLRNLPGKILICLVVNLFAAYLGIALGQLIPTKNDNMCFVSGYFIYFCLMAAFAWMNVMCFDIWQTFGSAKKRRGFQSKETARFLLYSLYGWGLPTLMTIITISLAKSDLLSENLRPDFKKGRCWFTYGTLASANLLFFSGPIGVLSLINFVLFLLTLRYCNRVKREIFRMQSSNVEKPMLRKRFFMDKTRFAMNTKLFIVMGITWFLELLSIVLYDRKKMFFWVISDSFNVLLGVFVFFIFVFKKRIWHAILVKLGFRSNDSLKTLPPATSATQSTYAPHSISMTRLNAIEGNLSLLCNAAKN
ncbi:G-protein coupled receptor Mth2 isoform X2 [Eurosta solidaginis]|uniref:G-protein coupled receptor Mth2 isoform X2 n=1 Tax=Eurosta solidaginis TaxID=178769 RepID=UPI003531776A